MHDDLCDTEGATVGGDAFAAALHRYECGTAGKPDHPPVLHTEMVLSEHHCLDRLVVLYLYWKFVLCSNLGAI